MSMYFYHKMNQNKKPLCLLNRNSLVYTTRGLIHKLWWQLEQQNALSKPHVLCILWFHPNGHFMLDDKWLSVLLCRINHKWCRSFPSFLPVPFHSTRLIFHSGFDNTTTMFYTYVLSHWGRSLCDTAKISYSRDSQLSVKHICLWGWLFGIEITLR